MRTFVYVDGFNLYYGSLKGTRHKWLDLDRFCRKLLPKNDVLRIKYFSARVRARPNDPDAPKRQELYLRALRTLPSVKIIYGAFLVSRVTMPVDGCPPGQQRYETVIKTEEKGSDVNLAVHLVSDGYKGSYDVAVVISNDSDLSEAVRIVRHDLGLVVGVVNPHKRASAELNQYASFRKTVRRSAVARCQFHNEMSDAKGSFHKPPTW